MLYDNNKNSGFDLTDWLEFERTKTTIQWGTPPFPIDPPTEETLRKVFQTVQTILSTSLKDVLSGKAFPRIPRRDMRDDY